MAVIGSKILRLTVLRTRLSAYFDGVPNTSETFTV